MARSAAGRMPLDLDLRLPSERTGLALKAPMGASLAKSSSMTPNVAAPTLLSPRAAITHSMRVEMIPPAHIPTRLSLSLPVISQTASTRSRQVCT